MKVPLLLTGLLGLTTACLQAHGKHDKHQHTKTAATTEVINTPKDLVLGHNNAKYTVDTNWAKADPKIAPVVNAHALAESRDGHIYLVTDHPKNDFLVFKKDGTFVRSFGKGLGGGHDIEFIVKDGVEYIIHVDCGWYFAAEGWKATKSTNGKVTILKTDGTIVRTLPTPHELKVLDPKHKFKPCDVAVTPQGTILIADGYGSNYVFEMSFEGKLIRKWGGPNNGEGTLSNAHGISIDTSDPKQPVVWVSSRNQKQIKAFTLDGKYLEKIDLPGAYAGQLFFRGDKIYTAVCWSNEKGTNKKPSGSGFIIVMDRKTKKVISAPGGSKPEYVDGKLQPLYQTDKTFIHGHDLYVDDKGCIYLGEWNANKRYPFKLTPVK